MLRQTLKLVGRGTSRPQEPNLLGHSSLALRASNCDPLGLAISVHPQCCRWNGACDSHGNVYKQWQPSGIVVVYSQNLYCWRWCADVGLLVAWAYSLGLNGLHSKKSWIDRNCKSCSEIQPAILSWLAVVTNWNVDCDVLVAIGIVVVVVFLLCLLILSVAQTTCIGYPLGYHWRTRFSLEKLLLVFA